MTQLEGQMSASAGLARQALDELRSTRSSAAAPQFGAAAVALDRFMAIHKEIITLSRRNREVRSFGLVAGPQAHSDGRMRGAIAGARAALAKHEFTATR